MQGEQGTVASLTVELLSNFLSRSLPTSAEQADNFTLWLGDKTAPGEHLRIRSNEVYAQIGAYFRSGLNYIIDAFTDTKLLQAHSSEGDVRLTFKGDCFKG
jgi:hypothetical protein